MTTVEKIHNEIDTAQARLLQQAESIIIKTNTQIDDKDVILLEKAKRLRNLGFDKAKDVKEANKIKESIDANKNIVIKSEHQAKLLKYYTTKYPFNKFLTIEELVRICDKYNLIYAPVYSYKETVPEKNLKDIETSKKLDSNDIASPCKMFKLDEENDVSGLKWKEAKMAFKGIEIPSNTDRWSKNSEILTKYFNKPVKCTYNGDYSTTYTVSRSGLFIAAPKSHFDLSDVKGMGKGFFSMVKLQPKDPIVFEFCEGNFVRVITKWGIEAEDKDLTLHTNN